MYLNPFALLIIFAPAVLGSLIFWFFSDRKELKTLPNWVAVIFGFLSGLIIGVGIFLLWVGWSLARIVH